MVIPATEPVERLPIGLDSVIRSVIEVSDAFDKV